MGQLSHAIARSLPGNTKEKGLAVLVEIGGGMFLTQLVEQGYWLPKEPHSVRFGSTPVAHGERRPCRRLRFNSSLDVQNKRRAHENLSSTTRQKYQRIPQFRYYQYPGYDP